MSEGPRDADELFDEFLEHLEGDVSPEPGSARPEDAAHESSVPTSFFFGVRASGSAPHATGGFSEGDSVGDFRLLRELGRGGMGQVWEAEERSLRRRVALKLVLPGRVGTRTLELFGREARAGGRLSHPAIVSVHGHGESGGVHWISQELVPGGWTLRDFIDEMRALDELPPDYDARVAGLVAELADALQAAHDAGVIHRDLKPQNILITEDDRPKLTDFGLARITDETALSRTGEFAGTYYYMSPEQVSARRMGLDYRTDVFSLGVVLYEALGLHRPFEGDTTHQIAEKILLHDPLPLTALRSRMPKDLSVIAAKAMEKRPDKRYASMADFASDLRRHLANEPIHARPATRTEQLVKWARRHPTRSAAGAVAAVAVIALGALGSAYFGKAVQAAEDGARVKRLSARTAYDELMDRAEELWPPHPVQLPALRQWEADALALVDRLDSDRDAPGLRDQLEQLERGGERSARPPGSAEAPAIELERARAHVASLRRAQEVRDDRSRFQPCELEESPGEDPALIVLFAHALAGRGHTRFGREAEGLANARRAVELATREEAEDELVLRALDAVAWASFACGLDEEALEASEEAEQLGRVTPGLAELHRGAQLRAAIEDAPAELERAEAALAALEGRTSEVEVELVFDSEEGRWRHALLRSIVADLEGLDDPVTGLLSESSLSLEHGWSITRRIEVAERLARGFQEGGPFQVRWEEASPEIERAYLGLDLSPQMGLVPLGPDPESGLWEFWHIPSGDTPSRAPDGSLRLEASSGIVFVLFPHSTGLMGSQVHDPREDNYRRSEHGDTNEWPLHEVELSPYFLSKCELTQGQWLRLTGETPSYWNPSSRSAAITLLHPVEQVSWFDATEVLGRYGLRLPSEAEWELACRRDTLAGDPLRASGRSLGELANLADDAFMRAYAPKDPMPGFDDGFAHHSPVGSHAPNPSGLHDMIGNLAEWTRDGYDRYFYAVTDRVDPVAPTLEAEFRTTRGGAYGTPATHAHPALRDTRRPFEAHRFVGFRAARAVDP